MPNQNTNEWFLGFNDTGIQSTGFFSADDMFYKYQESKMDVGDDADAIARAMERNPRHPRHPFDPPQ